MGDDPLDDGNQVGRHLHSFGAVRVYERIFPVTNDGPLLEEHLLLAELTDTGRPILSRHDLDDNPCFGRNREAIRRAFDSVSAELLIPLALKRDLIGFIAIGKKESGAFFPADDVDFLKALSNQSALSIANALAYREIQSLNAVLDKGSSSGRQNSRAPTTPFPPPVCSSGSQDSRDTMGC